jgi:hypothetical protein
VLISLFLLDLFDFFEGFLGIAYFFKLSIVSLVVAFGVASRPMFALIGLGLGSAAVSFSFFVDVTVGFSGNTGVLMGVSRGHEYLVVILSAGRIGCNLVHVVGVFLLSEAFVIVRGGAVLLFQEGFDCAGLSERVAGKVVAISVIEAPFDLFLTFSVVFGDGEESRHFVGLKLSCDCHLDEAFPDFVDLIFLALDSFSECLYFTEDEHHGHQIFLEAGFLVDHGGEFELELFDLIL